jgi:hypothetical protein
MTLDPAADEAVDVCIVVLAAIVIFLKQNDVQLRITVDEEDGQPSQVLLVPEAAEVALALYRETHGSLMTGTTLRPQPSARDAVLLATQAAAPLGPESVHPAAREIMIVWKRGEIYVYLINDRGMRFATLRASSPLGVLALARLQALSVEAS